MEKKLMINILNLFNGEMEMFKEEEKEKAIHYINKCIERQVPFAVKYGMKYVN